MTQATQFIFHTEMGHFLLYIAFACIVGGMPAPTATSGVAYRWAFASLNLFAANITRAFGTKVEKSPNWQDAVVKATDLGAVKPIQGPQ